MGDGLGRFAGEAEVRRGLARASGRWYGRGGGVKGGVDLHGVKSAGVPGEPAGGGRSAGIERRRANRQRTMRRCRCGWSIAAAFGNGSVDWRRLARAWQRVNTAFLKRRLFQRVNGARHRTSGALGAGICADSQLVSQFDGFGGVPASMAGSSLDCYPTMRKAHALILSVAGVAVLPIRHAAAANRIHAGDRGGAIEDASGQQVVEKTASAQLEKAEAFEKDRGLSPGDGGVLRADAEVPAVRGGGGCAD